MIAAGAGRKFRSRTATRTHAPNNGSSSLNAALPLIDTFQTMSIYRLGAIHMSEEHRTGSYVFENEWQSFRTRRAGELGMTKAPHTNPRRQRFVVAVKVIDIVDNDTISAVSVTVG